MNAVSRTYTDHARAIRSNLIEVERACGIPKAAELIKQARFSLGLLLEYTNNPHHPYVRAHNLRELRNENLKAPQADEPVFPDDVPEGEWERLEFCRVKLNDIAGLIYSRLYLAAGAMHINAGVDFISRAWQDTLLARCLISEALSNMATEDLPPIEIHQCASDI